MRHVGTGIKLQFTALPSSYAVAFEQKRPVDVSNKGGERCFLNFKKIFSPIHKLRLSLPRALFAGLMMLVVASPTLAHARADIRKYSLDIDVQRDGTYVATLHLERSFGTDAEAAQFAQYPLPFNPSLERLGVVEAYTRKVDGQVKPIETGAIRATLAPGLSGGTMFEDVQQKVVVFPDMAAHDEQVITVRREVFRPLFPGHFTRVVSFTPAAIWRDAKVTVTAPVDYPLVVDSHDVSFERTVEGDRVRHEWRHAATQPRDIVTAVDLGERSPRLFASSFKDQDEMGRAYGALSAPKEEVTAAVQAKADWIVAGRTDRRDQAAAIYDWVSKNIRYVALYLERGGVEPHFADAILRSGYGDCKDHVTLLAALLKAKGIESRSVIINLGNAYELSHAATITPLNHVLTYIPEFDVYADSTLGVAPFGELAALEYGKPAVLVGTGESHLIRMPVAAFATNRMETATVAHLQSDGRITGSTRSFARGPAGVALRFLGRFIQSTDRKALAARQLTSLGETGKGDLSGAPPTELFDGVSSYASFELDEQPGLLDGDSFAPPLGLALLARSGIPMAAPGNWAQLAENEPVPCQAGSSLEELTLSFPESHKVRRLPADRHFSTAFFSYDTKWSTAPDSVTVRRTFSSHVESSLCTGPSRREANEILRFIRLEQQTKVALVPVGEATKAE